MVIIDTVYVKIWTNILYLIFYMYCRESMIDAQKKI